MIDVHALVEDEWPLWRRLRLEALSEAPYAFGSTLAEWQGAGDREERWRARLRDVPYNAVAWLHGIPAGMIGATAPDDSGRSELISLWVAPWARGRRVGDALIEAVQAFAAARGAQALTLSVREDNGLAQALYRRHGFVPAGVVEDDGGPPELQMICALASGSR